MTGLFPSRFARLRNRRAFQLGFALAGLLLVGGLAGAALWRSQRPSSIPLLLPEPSDETRVSAPAQAEPSLVADPAPASNDPVSQRSPRTQPSAAALFAQALALRAEGKVDAAIAAHLRLQRLYATARETHLSFALAGRLLLEKGASEQALAQFDQYLAQPGDVAEEALVGRATALGYLRRSAAEATAWRQVLERHPGSIYATRAKERLAALAGKPKATTER
jgi:tetratricopeptide (TPR) repeat protein